MSKPMIRIVEVDGSITDREMNNAEYEQHLKDIADFENHKLKLAEAQAKKAAAEAKLAALGLTSDDLKALGL